MKKVLIAQRMEKIGLFDEERDNLDVNLIKFLEKSWIDANFTSK